MKKTQESGRSMVEMLGVLAIIGVLSIGGIAGYSMAMNRYRANEILDRATKYAVILYAGKQTYDATHSSADEGSGYDAPDFDESGLGDLPADTTFGEPTISADSVTMDVTFPSVDVCKAAASILGKTEACTDKKINLVLKQS